MGLPEMSALLASAPGGAAPSLFSNPLIPMVLMFAIFYFLLIAPMRKKQKKHAEMIGNLKTGDRVITNGGIHGIVVGVSESIVQVRIADQVKVDLSRSAVAALQSTEE
jgi:preprotein translocase subunit YajC